VSAGCALHCAACAFAPALLAAIGGLEDEQWERAIVMASLGLGGGAWLLSLRRHPSWRTSGLFLLAGALLLAGQALGPATAALGALCMAAAHLYHRRCCDEPLTA
jgi:hypothetical protein